MIAKGTVRVWVHVTKSWQNQLTDVLRPFSYLDHDSTIFKEGSNLLLYFSKVNLLCLHFT